MRDKETWHAVVHGVTKNWHDLATEKRQWKSLKPFHRSLFYLLSVISSFPEDHMHAHARDTRITHICVYVFWDTYLSSDVHLLHCDCILFHRGFPCLRSCATTSLLVLGRKNISFKDFCFWPLFSSVYSDIPTVAFLESTVPLKPVVWHLYSVMKISWAIISLYKYIDVDIYSSVFYNLIYIL